MANRAPRGKPKPTLAKVAAVAGVSVSQASDALRGLGRVSEETRDRVRTAARQLGYRSQGSARALRSGSKPLVVFHLDSESTLAPDGSLFPFWSNVVTGFVKTMQDHGHHVVLDIGGDLTDLADLPGEALLIGSTDPSRMRLPSNLGFGAVVSFAVDPDAEPARERSVVSLKAQHDYRAIGLAAAEFLISAGRRSTLLLVRPGRHQYLDRIGESFNQAVAAADGTSQLMVADIADPGLTDDLTEQLADLTVDAVLDFALSLAPVMAALERCGRSADIGGSVAGQAASSDPLIMTQAEVPFAHLRDPRVAFLSFQGLDCGEELGENLIATLSGRPPSDPELPFLISPPLRWRN
jgi:DNA-binding LacI/PurR family transcriptional regulator